MDSTSPILICPAWTDNYAYLVASAAGALVVDPADADALCRAAGHAGRPISHVLLTHHHADHTAGSDALARRCGAEVIGPPAGSHVRIDAPVYGGETLSPAGIEVTVIATPGHTRRHVAYYLPDHGALFSGDALFVAGCGRVAGGDYTGMWKSLCALRDLPGATRLYCGHNYTVENLEFAVHLEPDNADVGAALATARTADREHRPTVPSTLAHECRTNPFLRSDDPTLAAAIGMADADALSVFTGLRRRKDRW